MTEVPDQSSRGRRGGAAFRAVRAILLLTLAVIPGAAWAVASQSADSNAVVVRLLRADNRQPLQITSEERFQYYELSVPVPRPVGTLPPLPYVPVTGAPCPGPAEWVFLVSSENAEFALKSPAAVGGEGSVVFAFQFQGVTAGLDVAVPLTSAAVRGRILDRQGGPVAGCTVAIIPQRREGAGDGPWSCESWGMVQSDSEGRFAVRGLIPGPYQVFPGATLREGDDLGLADLSRASRVRIASVPDLPLSLSLEDVELAPFVVDAELVPVTVQPSAGTPPESVRRVALVQSDECWVYVDDALRWTRGARFRTQPEGGRARWERRPFARWATPDAPNFRISGVTVGHYVLVINRGLEEEDGYREFFPWVEEVTIRDPGTGFPTLLQPTMPAIRQMASVEGEIADWGDRPFAELGEPPDRSQNPHAERPIYVFYDAVVIRVEPVILSWEETLRLRVDPEGRFRISGLAPGRYEARVEGDVSSQFFRRDFDPEEERRLTAALEALDRPVVSFEIRGAPAPRLRLLLRQP